MISAASFTLSSPAFTRASTPALCNSLLLNAVLPNPTSSLGGDLQIKGDIFIEVSRGHYQSGATVAVVKRATYAEGKRRSASWRLRPVPRRRHPGGPAS